MATKEFFPGIEKIKFEGKDSKNPMAFRYHSEIFGSKVICTYPKLIAAYHVLHRLREFTVFYFTLSQ